MICYYLFELDTIIVVKEVRDVSAFHVEVATKKEVPFFGPFVPYTVPAAQLREFLLCKST